MPESTPEPKMSKQGLAAGPWTTGDYGLLSRTLGQSGAEDFVSRLGLEAGMTALDIACGTGAATLPLARLGAITRGLDMTPHLLLEARQRASAEQLHVTFDEGVAEDLPYPNETFDLVVSMFGAMYSNQPENVSAEMSRVLKPGGRVAMANWTRDGFSGQVASLCAPYMRSPAGVSSPMDWANETIVRKRLAPFFRDVEVQVTPLIWDLPMSVTDAARFFARHAGGFQVILGSLDEEERSALLLHNERLWMLHNTETFAASRTRIHNEYLEVRATRR